MPRRTTDRTERPNPRVNSDFDDVVAEDQKSLQTSTYTKKTARRREIRGRVTGDEVVANRAKQLRKHESSFVPTRMRCVSVHLCLNGKVLALFKDPITGRRVQMNVGSWPVYLQQLLNKDAFGKDLTAETAPVWLEHRPGTVKHADGETWST